MSSCPSRFGIAPDESGGGKGGAISFRAEGFLFTWLTLVVELVRLFGMFCDVPLKSIVCALAVPRVGGGSGLPPMRLTSTQSGSGEGVNGLLGFFGFGK